MKLENVKRNLEKNGFEAEIFNTSKEVNQYLLDDIKENTSIDFGGSITVEQIGTYEVLEEAGHDLYWHWKSVKENTLDRKHNSNAYITSTNALTEDGKLINMDGTGNRVAAMIIGFDTVYVITGKNKIVKDEKAGRDRIRNIAAPLNAKRLNRKTPCAHTGVCTDCDSPDRICKAEVILHKNPSNTKIKVLIVDEELGF